MVIVPGIESDAKAESAEKSQLFVTAWCCRQLGKLWEAITQSLPPEAIARRETVL